MGYKSIIIHPQDSPTSVASTCMGRKIGDKFFLWPRLVWDLSKKLSFHIIALGLESETCGVPPSGRLWTQKVEWTTNIADML